MTHRLNRSVRLRSGRALKAARVGSLRTGDLEGMGRLDCEVNEIADTEADWVKGEDDY